MGYGLLGRKLSHSYSPEIHEMLGSVPYRLYPIEPDCLNEFFQTNLFKGINVTIPYKKTVLPYCDSLSPVAQKLGAVNTIVRTDDGCIWGHNTDYYGFQYMLKKSGLNVKGKKVLVLGSGGASLTVNAVLRDEQAQVITISRSGENNYSNINRHYDASIIVNATPVGMYPNAGESPLDLKHFPQLEGVLDLIYNPARTALLLQAEELGITAENGLWMLIAQAKESAQLFLGRTIPDSVIGEIHRKLRLKLENIVLIGMPGSGKTTIGRELAKQLGKTFVDADEEITQRAGKSIPEIFAQEGESYFRTLETEVLAELCKQSGIVISTGGGCVTQPINRNSLRQNSTVIWVKRDLSALPTDGRPLSQQSNLSEMYKIREPMYASFSDYAIDNIGCIQDSVEMILNILKTECNQ